MGVTVQHKAILKAVALHLATEWNQDVETLGPLLTDMTLERAAVTVTWLVSTLSPDSDEFNLLNGQLVELEMQRGTPLRFEMQRWYAKRYHEFRGFIDYINGLIADNNNNIGNIRDRLLGYFGEGNPLSEATLQDLLGDTHTIMDMVDEVDHPRGGTIKFHWNLYLIEFLARSAMIEN